MDLEEYIVQEFKKLASVSTATGPRRIIFTGHSMGSALACVTAYRIMERYPNDPDLKGNIYVITFGSPKFARKKFTEWIETNLPNNFIT